MPHRLYDWQSRIRASLREYHSVRIGLDLLGEATPDEIHDMTEARGWDDLAAADIYAADNNLEATYIIRMYSVFERAVVSFWREIPGNQQRDMIDGEEMLNEVGAARLIAVDLIRFAQEVRRHRNHLVHGRINIHAGEMRIEAANRDLLTHLQRLPATWG